MISIGMSIGGAAGAGIGTTFSFYSGETAMSVGVGIGIGLAIGWIMGDGVGRISKNKLLTEIRGEFRR